MEDISYNYKDITPRYAEGQQRGYDTVEDEKAIQNALYNLFTIQQGQVPGKPWLGSGLNLFLFDNIGFFETRALEASFINTIEKYEPRVKMLELDIIVESEYNSISIDITYIILIGDRNSIKNYRFNLTYNNISNITLRDYT